MALHHRSITGRSRIIGVALGWAIALLPATSALAQVAPDITNEMVQAPVLTDQQRSEIDRYVESHKSAFMGAKPMEMGEARASILQPLTRPAVDPFPAFRLHYSAALEKSLQDLVVRKDDVAAINALVVAGELSTSKGVAILQAGFRSPSASVRYQAAYGFQRTFEVMRRSVQAPAMRGDEAEGLVGQVQKFLADEPDPMVAAALMRALVTASQVRTAQPVIDLGKPAAEALCKALAGRKDISGKELLARPVLDGLLSSFSALRDQIGGRGGTKPAPSTLTATADLVGAYFAHTKRVIASNGLSSQQSEEMRSVYAQLADAGHALIGLSGQALQGGFVLPAPRSGPGNAPETTFGALLKAAEPKADAQAALEIERIVGANGALTKAPFTLKPR